MGLAGWNTCFRSGAMRSYSGAPSCRCFLGPRLDRSMPACCTTPQRSTRRPLYALRCGSDHVATVALWHVCNASGPWREALVPHIALHCHPVHVCEGMCVHEVQCPCVLVVSVG